MIKKVLLTIAAVLCASALFAQTEWGGVKGTVVNRVGRTPIAQAQLVVSQGNETVATAISGEDGTFLMESIPNGMYDMTIKEMEQLVYEIYILSNLTLPEIKRMILAGYTLQPPDPTNF